MILKVFVTWLVIVAEVNGIVLHIVMFLKRHPRWTLTESSNVMQEMMVRCGRCSDTSNIVKGNT